MKRTPLKRSTTPIKRTSGLTPRRENMAKDNLRRNSSLNRVGVKMRKKLAGVSGYSAFSKAVRAARPICEIQWEDCTGKTQSVHHVIKLSQGGARTPGPLAERQGQVFMSTCNNCNQAVEKFPKRAKAEGFSKSNPFRGVGGRDAAKLEGLFTETA